jgi:integrase/recombinase XerD
MGNELQVVSNLGGARVESIEAINVPSIYANVASIPVQATNDEALVNLWLHGRSEKTQAAYLADYKEFCAFTNNCGLRSVTLSDVQGFADYVQTLHGELSEGKPRAPKSQARMIASVRSLLTFASKIGYIGFNVGAAMRQPKVKVTIAERILGEADTIRMLALETNERNRALLYTFYDLGARVSEVVGLKWKDIRPTDETATVTVYGKGDKTRFNVLTPTTWAYLQAIKPANCSPESPVFVSRSGGGCLRANRQAA